MVRSFMPGCCLVLVAALAACSTPVPSGQLQSKILSSQTKNGKGVPNGRSDSVEPFATLTQVADDPTYGFTTENPIKVGSANLREGPRNEKRYLNALRTASGEPLEYERVGSCCSFPTPNGVMGGGLLDVFRVVVPGSEKPRILYINMYDPGVLVAPVGFTVRTN